MYLPRYDSLFPVKSQISEHFSCLEPTIEDGIADAGAHGDQMTETQGEVVNLGRGEKITNQIIQ